MDKSKILAILIAIGTVASAIHAQLTASGVKAPAWLIGLVALLALFAPPPKAVEAPKPEAK